jgi:hypothetical protein
MRYQSRHHGDRLDAFAGRKRCADVLVYPLFHKYESDDEVKLVCGKEIFMKKILFSVLAVLTIFIFAHSVEAANLLNDPGFELSYPNGSFPSSKFWMPSWEYLESGAICTSTAAHTGECGLWEYTGNLGVDWWSGQYQNVSAAPGDVFTASAWVRS